MWNQRRRDQRDCVGRWSCGKLAKWADICSNEGDDGPLSDNNPWVALSECEGDGGTTSPNVEQVENRINRLIDSDSDAPEHNLAISDLARLIGNNEEANVSAWEYAVGTCKAKLAKAEAENSCAGKGGGGVVAPPSVRKGKGKKGKGGKSGPKRPQG